MKDESPNGGGQTHSHLGLTHASGEASGRDGRPAAPETPGHALPSQAQEQPFELDALERLQRVSLVSSATVSDQEVLEAILDAAIALMRADCGSVQVFDAQRGLLELVAHRNLPSFWVEFWQSVGAHERSCGAALQRRERVILEDIEHSPTFVGTPELDIQLRAGLRAMQSTPLVSRTGKLLGALSTHFRRVHRPNERELRLLDLLVRQAADLLDRRAADAERRRADDRVAALLLSAPDAIISIDQSQHVQSWSPGAERMFGYSKEEALGMSLDAIIPLRSRAAHRDHVARFAGDTSGPRHMDHTSAAGTRKNGEEFPIEATISRFHSAGEITLTVIVRDVTEERRLQRETKALADLGAATTVFGSLEEGLAQVAKALADSLADFSGVFVVQPDDGRVRRVAAASQNPDKAWIMAVMLRQPDEPRADHPIWRAIKERRTVVVEHPILLETIAQSDEHMKALQAAAMKWSLVVPFLVGDRCLGALGLTSSARRFDERDIALAEEAARRCALFVENARLLERERRAVQARDELLGIVAHDLRNPLSSILMQVASLRRRGPQPERRSQRQADYIDRAARRMNRIIDDLIEITQLEAGQLPLERAPLWASTLVHDVIDTHHDPVQLRSLSLEIERCDEVCMLADSARVLQVFDNLISNALKFTKQGKISIGIEKRASFAVLYVGDSGTGIAEHDVPHLFDRFYQAHRTGRGGAGLGLSIVKGLVEAHGGRVWVETALGSGTRVFFTLPLAKLGTTVSAPNQPVEGTATREGLE